MGLTATKEKKYAIDKIFPRHFLATAKAVNFNQTSMVEIMQQFAADTPQVIERVRNQLPEDFPTHLSETILDWLHHRVKRLLM